MLDNKKNSAAIILAAGSGSRMKIGKTKQTLKICGKSILAHTLAAFDKAPSVDHITVVCREDEIDFAKGECASLLKPFNIVIGGSCRAESARLGFLSIPSWADFVMIHDGARCLITVEEIEAVAQVAYISGAACASLRVSDTLKRVGDDGRVVETLDREYIRAAQTPQMFSRDIYERALAVAGAIDTSITDDNMLVERSGADIYLVDTLPTNIKITAYEDLQYAEYIISKRNISASSKGAGMEIL